MTDVLGSDPQAPRALLRRGSPLQRATAQSILGGVLIQACLAISGPLAARILGVEDRGYLALLMIFPSVLWQIGTLGVPFAIPYFLAQDVGGRRFVKKILPVLIAQLCILTPIHLGIVIAFATTHDPRVAAAAWWSLLALPGLTSSQYGLAMLQGTQRLFAF
ncbi:MAG TPA: hypothetical protein VIG64_00345, partial [Actinomycetota bacterium]